MLKKDYWGGWLLGGLMLIIIGRVLYNNHMDSLPHKYTITKKMEPDGKNIRFTYVVGRKTYEGKRARSGDRICWDCKYVVSYVVDDPSWSNIIKDHPIPDSVASLIIPGVYPEIPVEWQGGQVVVKEKYKEYILSE